MEYDIEALRKKYNVTPPSSGADSGGYDIEALRKKYDVPAMDAGSEQAPQDSGDTGGKGFAIGMAQSLLNATEGLGNLALSPFKKIIENTTGNKDNKIKTGFSQISPEVLEAKTTAEKAGNVTGNVAQFLLPQGKVTKVTKALPFISKVLARTIPDIFISAAQTGGDPESTLATGVTSAVTNAMLPGAGATGGVKNFIKNGTKSLAGGYVADVSSGMAGDRGEDRTGASALIPGAGTLIGGAVPALEGSGKIANKAIGAVKEGQNAEAIMQRVARIPKSRQAAFERTAGESVGDYLTKRGIFGAPDALVEKLYSRFAASKEAADKALESLGGEYKVKPIGTALDDLAAREARVSTEGAPSQDLDRITELAAKHKEKGLNMYEINEVKRLFEKNIKLDFLKQNLPEGVARANNIDSSIRRWQFDQANKLGLENLPAINRETKLARQLMDDIGKEYQGSAGNNAITLSDWVLLSGGDPTAIAGFLTKKFFGSKRVQSAVAKWLAGEKKIGTIDAQFRQPQTNNLLPSGSALGTEGNPIITPAPREATVIEPGARDISTDIKYRTVKPGPKNLLAAPRSGAPKVKYTGGKNPDEIRLPSDSRRLKNMFDFGGRNLTKN